MAVAHQICRKCLAPIRPPSLTIRHIRNSQQPPDASAKVNDPRRTTCCWYWYNPLEGARPTARSVLVDGERWHHGSCGVVCADHVSLKAPWLGTAEPLYGRKRIEEGQTKNQYHISMSPIISSLRPTVCRHRRFVSLLTFVSFFLGFACFLFPFSTFEYHTPHLKGSPYVLRSRAATTTTRGAENPHQPIGPHPVRHSVTLPAGRLAGLCARGECA